MISRLSRPALCALMALSISTAVAFADPSGKTTLEETLKLQGSGDYRELGKAKGEKTVVRTTLAKANKNRDATRRTILFLGHMTDPQVADEMSPARGELVDPAGNPFASGWRPQEALNLQSYDQLVRNVNSNRVSPFTQGNGKRARMQFVLNTGDMADSLQLNEAEWYIALLEGGKIDPFTGREIGPSNPCPQADEPAEVDALNAAVRNRLYTGIQDYDDWRGAPTDRYLSFWDPDEAPPLAASPFASYPRHPGLMERAQRVFDAEGLKVPWYTARGNHDALWQGTFRPIAAATVLTTACFKPFPNEDFNPARYSDHPERLVEDLSDPAFVSRQLELARLVPPDPRRRFLIPGEFKDLHGNANNGHGFKFVQKSENTKSKGAASYYGFTKNGVRFLAIDTNAEGGSPEGNVDDPQYKWVERELKAATKRKQLVVAFSHHPLSSQNAETDDEDSPPCDDPETDAVEAPSAGCDLDPRDSKPIHLGLKGKKPLKNLFLKYPNFVAYVVGHIHENRVTPYKAKGGKSGFWEISTASEADWPIQARLIELMDNRDGTLSIFGTVLDSAAPTKTPAPGAVAGTFSNAELGSLARRLAANDPQVGQGGSEVNRDTEGAGLKADRNVELLLRNPLG